MQQYRVEWASNTAVSVSLSLTPTQKKLSQCTGIKMCWRIRLVMWLSFSLSIRLVCDSTWESQYWNPVAVKWMGLKLRFAINSLLICRTHTLPPPLHIRFIRNDALRSFLVAGTAGTRCSTQTEVPNSVLPRPSLYPLKRIFHNLFLRIHMMSVTEPPPPPPPDQPGVYQTNSSSFWF